MSKYILIVLTLCGLATPVARAQQTSGGPSTRTAIFAGGCFWCMQPPYDRAKGVVKTVVGYTGGKESDANYSAVSGHKTQHREAIEVSYDPGQISYDQLLDIFWRQINPTQENGQFADIGLSYQAAIYFANDDEKKAAGGSKEALTKSGKFQKPIVTEILPAMKFYPAEEYHQKYYLRKNADYKAYHVGSGRAAFLEKLWGKESNK